MRIAENLDVRVCVFDIEAMWELFDIGIYNPDSGEGHEFQVSAWKNQLYEFVKFYTSGKFHYWVSFNGIGYDHQVLQYILENYEKWYDLENLQITRLISEFSSKAIDDQNYGIAPPYKESDFPVKCIDVFRIHHFDNDARRTSLKWCEFMMNMDVEEMPIHFLKTGMTKEDVEETRKYRCHDVQATYKLFQLTLGEDIGVEELADYKGKNKVQERLDLMKETGMECLNWSDVKIGEEWNRLDYKNSTGDKDGYLYPKKVKYPFGQRIKNFFPESAQYSTTKLQEFKRMFGEEFILNQTQKYPIEVGKTTYTLAKGGIHSNESHRAIVTPPGWYTRDADVGSQYPNAARKWRTYPPHLKEDVMHALVCDKIDRKAKYKAIVKSLKEKNEEYTSYASLEGMVKLALNGGLYGKFGQKGSFLENPEGAMKITIGCQMEILLLVEMMEQAGINVISGNTDGIVSSFPESKKEVYEKVCKEWEERVGNTDLGKLEYTDFAALWQESVNHYIAKKIDGSVKKKGRFVTVYGSPGCEINKNKSKRIIALALEKYFIDKISPIEFISSHKNIFDFCIAKKAFGQLHYEEIISGEPNGIKHGMQEEVIVHKKLIRYYVSKTGNVIMKRGINTEGGIMNNHCEAKDKEFPWMGQPKLKYFNKVEIHEDFSKYEVDYTYYILETLKRIDKIEGTKKADKYADQFKTEQISLF